MKKLYLILFIFILFSPSLTRAASQPFLMPLEQSGAALYEGPYSFLFNPVFADDDAMPFVSYRYMASTGLTNYTGNHRALLSGAGFVFSYNYMDHVMTTIGPVHAGAHVMNISKGFLIGNIFGFGAGYSFSVSDDAAYNKYSGWNFGFLLRPWKYISLGVSFLDNWSSINGIALDVKQIYSVAIRPCLEWLTLSADGIRTGSQSFTEMTWVFGLSGRLPYNINLSFKMDLSLNMYFALTVPVNLASRRVSSIVYEGRGAYLNNNYGLFAVGASIPQGYYGDSLTIKTNPRLLVISIKGSLPDNQKQGFFSRRYVHLDLLRIIRRAGKDKLIDGIVLKIDSNKYGLAQIQEIRDSLRHFKAEGKKIYAYMAATGNREYYLATAADEIILAPNTTFKLPGLAMKVYFFKKLLDSIGVKVESFAMGEYKSLNDRFTRKTISEDVKKNYRFVLDDLTDQFVKGIAKGRKLTEKQVRNILKKGLFLPQEALKSKLVDSVSYYDSFIKSRKSIAVSFNQYIYNRRVKTHWGRRPLISVVYVGGSLVHGRSSSSFFSKTTGDASFSYNLRRAAAMSSAVVIRINSGGGSAKGSDYMWRTIKEVSKRYKKPIIISFGDIAASGGYYMACVGKTIFANNATITGSIGVVLGKVSLKDLYKKLGISTEVIKNTPFSDSFSEHRTLTAEEKKLFIKERDFIYDRFTGIVMKSRKLKKDELDKLARGRIFTGKYAHKKKLIDERGNLMTAILFAKKRARISGKVSIREFPYAQAGIADLFKGPSLKRMEKQVQEIIDLISIQGFSKDYVQTVMPYRIVIE